jgi:glycosyltransferase involved in cell wall biosynthesis
VRALLCIHHRLDPDQGAPGATLALGEALEQAGCTVGYVGYDHVFADVQEERVGYQLGFPWFAARELRRRAGAFDVVDASTGDAWVWASLGRPGSRATALVTRAHGLEHVVDESVRAAAREGGRRLSWKYPIYHGGLRLWEVRRSLRLADHCVLLNPRDRDYVRDRMGIADGRLSVVPNGIADRVYEAPPAEPVEGPVRLAFIGRWSAQKGAGEVVETGVRLHERGIDFSLAVLGTLSDPDAVLADFPDAVRPRISVTPRFENERLPELLAGHELFVFPSRSEGSSVALLEAMACGLAPVATPVGAAPEVIQEGSGVVVDAAGVPDAVVRVASDRGALLDMRRAAQRAVAPFRWSDVAQRTIEVYERALARRPTPTAG